VENNSFFFLKDEDSIVSSKCSILYTFRLINKLYQIPVLYCF
jgi:hypothetical protein